MPTREDKWKHGVVIDPGYIAEMSDDEIEEQLETTSAIIGQLEAHIRIDPEDSLVRRGAPERIERSRKQIEVLKEEQKLRVRTRTIIDRATKGWDRHRLQIAIGHLTAKAFRAK